MHCVVVGCSGSVVECTESWWDAQGRGLDTLCRVGFTDSGVEFTEFKVQCTKSGVGCTGSGV